MPTPITCLAENMWHSRGLTLDKFGQDQTGQILYRFNDQGFRADGVWDFVPDYAFFGCSIVAGIGVPIEQTFASMFAKSHNYGIAGEYSNASTLQIIQAFVHSKVYSKNTKMAVIWTDRNPEHLDSYLAQLCDLPMIHFFCGELLNYPHCYKMVANIDWDASGTHPGPRTHRLLHGILCALFSPL